LRFIGAVGIGSFENTAVVGKMATSEALLQTREDIDNYCFNPVSVRSVNAVKKVLVIGSGGSGKSTFARQLGELLDIEVVYLDKIYSDRSK